MSDKKLNINDKVVTSKGLYGRIVEIKDNKIIITIGTKNIELDSSQIIPICDKPYAICYYTDGYATFTKRITLPTQFMIYDYSNPMDNPLYTYCKKQIKSEYPITILKIEL